MSIDFKRIKKYSKTSNNFDEKLECLNKELKKTGLDEMANTTGGLYVGSQTNPNSGYAEITGKNFNGKGFAMSGDTNLGQGNFGGATIRADGAALSPPHPVTGERRVAYTKGSAGVGGSKIARPGERPTPSSRMTGPIMWYWNPSGGAGSGSWESLEFNSPEVHGNSPYPTYQAGWGYWGSGAFGFLLLRNDGAPFASLFNTIGEFDPKDSVPTTTVITRDNLGNSGFLPIDIKDLSKRAFDWLKGKAEDAMALSDGFKGILDAIPPFIAFLLHQTNDNSPWTPENPFPLDLNDKQTEGMKNDIEGLFDKWGDKRVDELNDGAPMTNDEMNELNKTINANKSNKGSDALDAKYPSSRLTLNNIGNPKAFAGNVGTKKDGSKTPIAIEDNYVFEGDSDASVPGAPSIIKFMLNQPNVQDAIKKSGLDYPYRIDQEATYDPLGDSTPVIKNKNMPIKVNLRTTSSFFEEKKSLNESVKLGHFEPEVLNVNIDDLRKGIAPEFPKDPPPEMIDGYAANSRLAPKKIESSPFIKITKKDIAKNHLLTDKQISDFMNDIKMINDYIKKNPADLIYAQQRYPKHDPRLAQLNWQMDQMMDASKEYVDKQFPENQKLFNKIKKKIKNTIDQTDPKNFKGTKLPKFDKTHLEDFKRKKEVYSRFMKKPVKTKKLFQKTKKRG